MQRIRNSIPAYSCHRYLMRGARSAALKRGRRVLLLNILMSDKLNIWLHPAH